MTDWWKKATFYHIYPRSFYDSNGDGIGDLKGISEKVPYLKWLGVDAIWISPFYPSPMDDFGYDVSNYTDVEPIFGTLNDFDLLIDRLHSADLKLVIDFIPNHTSDRHPWFLESRSSRTSPYRDWYIWKDPAADGGPPNNWLSRFNGKSGWKFDAFTEQYYLHSFLESQPDVNWRNPQLASAMSDALHFWLRRGVDGFRVDVSYRAIKDPLFRDNPPDPSWKEGMDPSIRFLEIYNKNYPDVHQMNKLLRNLTNQYPEKVLIGEMYLPFKELVKHYGENDEFHLPFNFSLIGCNWSAEQLKNLIEEYEANLNEEQWPNWVLGNHDKSRVGSRVGRKQLRNAMMLLLTLRGTPTIYYGDELGMCDGYIPPEYIQDPCEKNMPGLGLGRDPERTPMQWNTNSFAGFSSAAPWLPVQNDFEEQNVETQTGRPHSDLAFTRELLSLRRSSEDLQLGAINDIRSSGSLLFYRRGDEMAVCLNFSGERASMALPNSLINAAIILETRAGCALINDQAITVEGNEAVILKAPH